MAKLTTILAILIITLALHPQMALSTDPEDIEDEEEYVLDTPLFSHLRTRSRFLAGNIIKKDRRCDNSNIANNICNGISANKGRGLLFCCKKHCRNVLSDKDNCGHCGHKCKQGERCCIGICTNVFFNKGSHCGKCNKKCSPGVPCENGLCGYA